MSQLISLRLDEDLVQRLDTEAALLTAKRGEPVSRSLVIAIAVARYLNVEIPQDWERGEPAPTLDLGDGEEEPFRCPSRPCTFRAKSKAAVCGQHGRRVVPTS